MRGRSWPSRISRRSPDTTARACRRLLLTLVKQGYAAHDGKFFKLKPRIMRLGFAYLKSASLPSILQPSMDDLSRETEESCSASVLDGGQIVYIARASKPAGDVDQSQRRQPPAVLLLVDGPCPAGGAAADRGPGLCSRRPRW